MRPIFLLVALLPLLLSNCQRDEAFPKATTSSGGSVGTSNTNAIALTPTDWRFSVGDLTNQRNPNKYRETFVTNSSATTSPIGSTSLVGLSSKSSSYTLGMATSTIADTMSFCYWVYSQNPPTSLRIGQTLTLKVKVKLTDVQGPGISLVIRGDKDTKKALIFSSTQDKITIQGIADYMDYSVSLPYTQLVDVVSFYLVMLPKTTGTVTFSDVSLQAN